MYRCCSCETSVAWFRASGASPWFPHTCPACGVEQHRPQFGLAYVVCATLLALTGPPAMFLLVVTGNAAIAFVLFAALALWAFWLEERSYRAGRLVATSPGHKRTARIVVAAMFLPLLALVAWLGLR